MRNGILVIDKEPGTTSFQVVRAVRKKLQIRKVGHTGTLDPIATGVLPICLGKATKLVQFIMAGHKVYEGTMRLGVVTDTYDAEGAVVRQGPLPSALSAEAIRKAAGGFTGSRLQTPPPFSAVKHNGQPLYKLARKGIVIEKEPRPITVFSFEILSVRLPDVDFRVHCTKGTYVRSLVHELGEALGPGGHLLNLRRTRSGRFTLEQTVTLAELDALIAGNALSDALIPPNEALSHIPGIEIDSLLARDIRCGKPVSVRNINRLLDRQDIGPGQESPYLRLFLDKSDSAEKAQSSGDRKKELVSVLAWPEERNNQGDGIIRPIKVWAAHDEASEHTTLS